MLYQEVNFTEFEEAFRRHGRENQFSAEALRILYDFFEEMTEPIMLDVIDICCSITESTLEEFNVDHGKKYTSLDQIYSYLENQTEIVGTTENSVIFFDFR